MFNREQKTPVARPDGRFACSDLYGSAYLVALGHRVIAVEPNGGRRMAFLFEVSDRLHQDYLCFLNNDLVPVQDFVSGVYRLKRLLHEAEGGGR